MLAYGNVSQSTDDFYYPLWVLPFNGKLDSFFLLEKNVFIKYPAGIVKGLGRNGNSGTEQKRWRWLGTTSVIEMICLLACVLAICLRWIQIQRAAVLIGSGAWCVNNVQLDQWEAATLFTQTQSCYIIVCICILEEKKNPLVSPLLALLVVLLHFANIANICPSPVTRGGSTLVADQIRRSNGDIHQLQAALWYLDSNPRPAWHPAGLKRRLWRVDLPLQKLLATKSPTAARLLLNTDGLKFLKREREKKRDPPWNCCGSSLYE